MSQSLIIWLPGELSAPWQWFHGDRQGTAISDTDKAGLGELDTAPVQVVISGQSITQLRHDLPAMKDSDRMSAAGFALENQIAAPLTSQHLVLGPADTQKVAIVAHEKMKHILDHLEKAGISPSGLYADFDVVAGERPLLFSDRVIYPGLEGYTVDAGWTDAEGQEDQLSQLVSTFDFGRALNLRTGEYAAKSNLPINAALLTRIAALLLVTFTAWLGLLWTQTRAMSAQTAALKTETASLYSTATGKPAPANPALAVTRAVKSGGAPQASFLDLSSLLFSSLAQTDGIMIETLQYDHQKNQLTLRLIYPQFESAGALEALIAQSGGDFRSGGVREQSGRLIGDAALKAAP